MSTGKASDFKNQGMAPRQRVVGVSTVPRACARTVPVPFHLLLYSTAPSHWGAFWKFLSVLIPLVCSSNHGALELKEWTARAKILSVKLGCRYRGSRRHVACVESHLLDNAWVAAFPQNGNRWKWGNVFKHADSNATPPHQALLLPL